MLRVLGEKKELTLALSGTFWGFDSEERKELILTLSGTFWGFDLEERKELLWDLSFLREIRTFRVTKRVGYLSQQIDWLHRSDLVEVIKSEGTLLKRALYSSGSKLNCLLSILELCFFLFFLQSFFELA